MPANTCVVRIWEHNLKLGCFLGLYNQIPQQIYLTDFKLNRAYIVELTLTMRKLLYIRMFSLLP